MRVDVGVIRQVLHFELGTIEHGPATEDDLQGELLVTVHDDEAADELPARTVIYTLAADRLRSMLDQAAAGADIDSLILSLDAVALASDGNDAD